MHTRFLFATQIVALFIISLLVVPHADADPLSAPREPHVTQHLVLTATAWAPQGHTDSMTACELAKEQALVHLGIRAKELQLVERTGTTSFPSRLTCRWDPAQHAYQAVLSMETPDTHSIRTLTADRLY